MTVLTGSLKAAHKPDFTGYRVTADYDRAYQVDGRTSLPASQVAEAAADGGWRMPLDFDPLGEVRLTVRTPTGVEVGSRTADDFSKALPIKVADLPEPVVIPPSDDPTYGRAVTLTGRALQPDGSGVPAGFPAVLWGKPAGGTPLPVLVAGTTDAGYFSGDWPAAVFEEAWGTVGGGAQIPVQLVDERFPRVVLLVVPEQLEVPPHDDEDDDCECHTPKPPRTPDAVDLVANPQAYSEDRGGCVTLTTPNRTLEEVVFHAVVRTTEPEIRGTTLTDPALVPRALAERIDVLAKATAPQRLAAADAQTLRLDPGVVADQLGDGQVGTVLQASKLLTLQRLTDVKAVKHVIDLIGPYLRPGRVSLDAEHTVDWDDDPTIYQATSIAIGHLLTLKQVWRADGYSLGDLLYSLPLAPGQKKQIAIVDWERKEQTIRTSQRVATERLSAELAHDRDIRDIIDSSLSEHSRGSSSASVSAVGGGIGAFIGPVVLGGGGGSSSASSTAHTHSWRDVAATALNQARDRTSQAASAVRGQRSTTIQTTTQGESLRAQTEVVANHNHCHALSMEYFEVLRHFKVTTELAGVRECLFIPFELSPFTANKALRWWEPLKRSLSRRDLRGGFDALERIRTGWAVADVPLGRYADEELTYADGELTMAFSLPRPADDATDQYVAANWAPWAPLLPQPPKDMWDRYLGNVLPKDRNRVWDERLAPLVAAKLVDGLKLSFRLDDGSYVTVPVDPTLVSRFRQDDPLQVALQPDLSGVNVVRAKIKAVALNVSASVPYTAKVVARRGSLHYRTDHLSHHLFVDYAIDDELGVGPATEIGVHLDRTEKRNPRKEDVLLAARLVAHLNERLEFYHQAIWRYMHPNRRYLLLDGVIAPNADGRSVASVVENRVIGIVGNCLVMPVVPGKHLDPNYKTDAERKATLLDLYAVNAPPPTRISVPTKGVFAEAVLGACNSCEKKDDTRFWRWEESPIPETPPAIATVSTASRRSAPPDLRPDPFPDPIVHYQQIPDSPDPTGLGAALKLIGTPNLFRDLTGLDLNQQASAAAFGKALETAQFFGTQAGNLAQQRYANREMDRNLERVKKAVDDKLITPEQGRTLTEQFIRSGSGKGASTKPAPSDTQAVKKAIDRAAASENGSVKVSRPAGSVEVNTSGNGPIDFDVNPPVSPVKQPTANVCWAAGGAMLMSWKQRKPLTIQAAADAAGAAWRTKVDADQPLTVADIKAYAKAIGMSGESPMCYLPRGLFRLLAEHGPLWVIGDDAIAGNKMAHVRVVTGMHGDGTSDGTQVYYIDPADGVTHHESFTAFSNHLEAADPVSLHLGIYHY